MRPVERLLQRLRDELPELDIQPNDSIEPIRRGRHGKAAGAWAWEVKSFTGRITNIGSEDTVGECLRASALTTYVNSATGAIEICAEAPRVAAGGQK